MLQELPENVFIIAACNPHRSDSTAASHSISDISSTDYYVRKLHPTMQLLKWNYGALDQEQEQDYIRAKFKMMRSNDENSLGSLEQEILSQYIVSSQQLVRNFIFQRLKDFGISDKEAATRSSSCVSQRDIQRVFVFYNWLLKSYCNKNCDHQVCHPHRQAIFASLGLVYYMRLPKELRKKYCDYIDSSKKSFPGDLKFQKAFADELKWYADHVVLPPGIAKTDALKENLFATIICCVTRVPLIIEGAPGTSKTLSFNIAVANLKGSGSKKKVFQESTVYPSLEPQFYQCSRRTTSKEIETVFKRAENVQKHHNNEKSPQLSVVFMDEAGLPEQAHESLKVLHFYLEHPITSFVAITNHPLDAAKTNRAVSVFRSEASLCCKEDLHTLAVDCMEISTPIPQLCDGYAQVVRDKRFANFYGLRDFMYFLIYLRRNLHVMDEQDYEANRTVINEHVMRSLERNFGGVTPKLFSEVCDYFQMVMI